MKTGLIYCYKHIPSNKYYIGQTTNFKKRQKEHLSQTRTNLKFHNLLRKHYNDFEITILQQNIPITQLDKKEKYYISLYDSFGENGFNLTSGGDGGFQACQKYWKQHPEQLKRNIQHSQPLAVKAAQEWRKNNPDKEKIRLDQLHLAASQWRKNNPNKVQEHIQKAQKAAQEWRKNNPQKVQQNIMKATEATKKKVRLINTGESFSSASQAGRIYNIPASNISACCRGVRKSAGKDLLNNKLVWEYI